MLRERLEWCFVCISYLYGEYAWYYRTFNAYIPAIFNKLDKYLSIKEQLGYNEVSASIHLQLEVIQIIFIRDAIRMSHRVTLIRKRIITRIITAMNPITITSYNKNPSHTQHIVLSHCLILTGYTVYSISWITVTCTCSPGTGHRKWNGIHFKLV